MTQPRATRTTDIDWASDIKLPFASVFDDHVRSAVAQVRIRQGWERSAIDDLGAALRAELSLMACPALLELFSSGNQNPTPVNERSGALTAKYRQFVSSLATTDLREVRSSFPVLGDLLDLCSAQWVETTNEAIGHITAARGDLDQHLGIDIGDPVVAAEIGLGDRHAGGRTVGRFVTSTGAQFVYKPRSLRSERAFFDLWRNFRDVVDDPEPVPTILDLAAFGLVEYVHAAPVQDASNYWRRAGEMAGLLHLCVAGDLHNENLIAAGSQPVPIDLECINQPALDATDRARQDLVTYSVLATGLFPHRYSEHWGGPVDLAGLFAGIPEQSPRQRLFWRHLGTDDVGHALMPYARIRDNNFPADASGAPIQCDLPALLDGLESAWRHAPALVDSVGDWGPVRTLRCGTKMYVQARTSMMELDALQDRDLFVARSLALPPVEGANEASERLIIEAESRALQRLDIPIHRAHGCSFLPDRGGPIPDFFADSGHDRMQQRVARLRDSGAALDRTLVTLAVEQFDGRRLESPFADCAASSGSPQRVKPPDAVAGAVHIGHQLLNLRVRTAEGDAWLEVDQRTPMRGLTDNTSLHSGTDGIALFFAALAAVTGDDLWRDACISALAAGPRRKQSRIVLGLSRDGRAACMRVQRAADS